MKLSSRLKYFFWKASQEIFLAPPGPPRDFSRIAVSAMEKIFYNYKDFEGKKLMNAHFHPTLLFSYFAFRKEAINHVKDTN